MIGYRAATYHTPLWVEPNVNAGRFNRASEGPVQYFCEHPLGPLAEAVRRLPDIPLAIEIVHAERVRELGYEAFATECLARARRHLEGG